MSDGQRAYEERRAAKAGMSPEKWADAKARAAVQARPAASPEPKRPPGLFKRLLDRAHQPLKASTSGKKL